MPEALPVLLFSNPRPPQSSFADADTRYFVVDGRVRRDSGVLPDDLLLVMVIGKGFPAAKYTRPLPDGPDPGGDPWFHVATASNGVANGPRIVVWGRRVTLKESRQSTAWKVGVGPVRFSQFGNENYYGSYGLTRFGGGWYRWPQQFRFSQITGVTSTASYRWAPVTTIDASADSVILRPGQFAGQGLSAVLMITTGVDSFSGRIVAPFTGSGLKAGPSGMDAEYCRHDGGEIPGGYVTGAAGTDDYTPPNELYVSMTLSIAPAPNVTFPVGDRPVRAIGQSFADNMDGFTVSSTSTTGGSASARIEP